MIDTQPQREHELSELDNKYSKFRNLSAQEQNTQPHSTSVTMGADSRFRSTPAVRIAGMQGRSTGGIGVRRHSQPIVRSDSPDAHNHRDVFAYVIRLAGRIWSSQTVA